MKKILIPIDFSPVTSRVLDTVAPIAIARRAKVYLVHVAPLLAPELSKLPVPQQERDIVAHLFREEHEKLQDLADDLGKRGCDAGALLVEGHPVVEKILDKAQRLKADLIVMGSHGHGKVYDLLVGSTCEGVLRGARVPVMIVPITEAEAGERRHSNATDSKRESSS